MQVAIFSLDYLKLCLFYIDNDRSDSIVGVLFLLKCVNTKIDTEQINLSFIVQVSSLFNHFQSHALAANQISAHYSCVCRSTSTDRRQVS